MSNKKPVGVMIGYCHPATVDAAFHSSLVSLLIFDSKNRRRVVQHGDVCAVGSGPRIATARNIICKAMMSHVKHPEWLLMLDTDMTFGPELVESLLAVADPIESPIVGGLCFAGGRAAKIEPTLRVATKSNGSVAFETVWDYPPDELVAIDATGAACLLIHRSVLEKMNEQFGETAHPWFAESWSYDSKQEYGEDVTFCLRARGLGFPVKVHTGIRIGHMKPQVIDEQSYLDFRTAVAAVGGEEYEAAQMARSHPNQQVANV